MSNFKFYSINKDTHLDKMKGDKSSFLRKSIQSKFGFTREERKENTQSAQINFLYSFSFYI